jgi:hypothetical protein
MKRHLAPFASSKSYQNNKTKDEVQETTHRENDGLRKTNQKNDVLKIKLTTTVKENKRLIAF